ncbi:DUF6538 domain-containing protein [Pseudogemmobacter sonorensis]|uniref:DUF6538 domain-containing protein n=1 Tax=Pseudogemmobacter sonorensis TaxID=2989681 RepID=UPI0036BCE62F
MAETHHLQKRGDTWYFVRRVPLHLVPVIGKTFVKRSLGTPDLKVAKAKRNAQEVAADALFAGAEAALSEPAAGTPGPVSMAVLTEHLRAHIATADEKSATRLAADPPENEAQKAEMKMDAEIEVLDDVLSGVGLGGAISRVLSWNPLKRSRPG